MCIRDRCRAVEELELSAVIESRARLVAEEVYVHIPLVKVPVSYTHLNIQTVHTKTHGNAPETSETDEKRTKLSAPVIPGK